MGYYDVSSLPLGMEEKIRKQCLTIHRVQTKVISNGTVTASAMTQQEVNIHNQMWVDIIKDLADFLVEWMPKLTGSHPHLKQHAAENPDWGLCHVMLVDGHRYHQAPGVGQSFRARNVYLYTQLSEVACNLLVSTSLFLFSSFS
mmetsp:Transcript_17678/g.42581  ORF Transcript_17678/g.42581 Transcript_17678/m.42581 type:complete len:144 (-) Transcript_17678:567-998(-)